MVRGLAAALAALAACSFDAPKAAVDGMPATPDEAGTSDAPPPFDPATDCPTAYTVQLASTAATSRYRVITALDVFWPHSATCNADRRGVTHAAALDTMQELLELEEHVDPLAVDRFYLGGIQDPAATATTQGWIWFDGTPLLQTAWHMPENEPDDGGGGNGEVHGQQLVILDTALTYLHDATGVTAYGIVCECDGTPVTAMAQDFVDRDPQNPNP